jgi:uncharacterized membrane protein YeaQ/YmgE (transglycosylase-associated protein family)
MSNAGAPPLAPRLLIERRTVGFIARLGFLRCQFGDRAMTILEFLLLLLVAGICGSLSQALVGYSHGGCLVSIAIGFIGALLGTWLARLAGFPDFFTLQIGNQAFPVIWSIIGAVLFTAVLGLLTFRTARPPIG